MHRELQVLVRRVSDKLMAPVMRKQDLRAKGVHYWLITTVVDLAAATAPNRLVRQFIPHTCATSNRVWVGAVPYLRTHYGQLYLTVLLDLAAREVVDWAIPHSLEGALILDAR